MQDIPRRLADKRAAARAGGGARRVETQHAKGKLTARERLEILLDEGSFEESHLAGPTCRARARFTAARLPAAQHRTG